MKKVFVKIVSILLILCLMLLTACTKKDKGNDTDNQQNKTENVDDKQGQNANEDQTEPVTEEKSQIKIGNFVHYNINLDIGDKDSVDDDWIVFYQDEEKGLTYLIAANFVPIENKYLANTMKTLGLKGSYTMAKDADSPYGVDCNVYDVLGVSDKVSETFKSDWKVSDTKTVHKNAYLSRLLNEDAWSTFVLKSSDGSAKFDESIMAVGAPTINLWALSWEQNGYSKIYFKESISTDENQVYSGYLLGKDDNPSDEMIKLEELEKSGFYYDENYDKVKDKIYFSSQEDDVWCTAYWLASPSTESSQSNFLLAVYQGYGEIDGACFDNSNTGVRPVICMKSSLIGTDSSSEIYYLDKNIND